MRRLPVVGVMGSGTRAWGERCRVLGPRLAALGVHLLTGGGGGVMEAISRAFAETPGRAGQVIGVLPCASPSEPATPRSGYPNRFVEIAIRTHLPLSGDRGREMLSRNHINVLSSDAVVALPGGAGTASEVRLALAYRTPIVAFVAQRGEIPGLPDEVPDTAQVEGVVAFLRRHLPRPRGGGSEG